MCLYVLLVSRVSDLNNPVQMLRHCMHGGSSTATPQRLSALTHRNSMILASHGLCITRTHTPTLTPTPTPTHRAWKSPAWATSTCPWLRARVPCRPCAGPAAANSRAWRLLPWPSYSGPEPWAGQSACVRMHCLERIKNMFTVKLSLHQLRKGGLSCVGLLFVSSCLCA